MTPELLDEISAKWTRISDYGNERMHAEAASEFIPELIKAVEQLQAENARMSGLLKWCVSKGDYLQREQLWDNASVDQANAAELRQILELANGN